MYKLFWKGDTSIAQTAVNVSRGWKIALHNYFLCRLLWGWHQMPCDRSHSERAAAPLPADLHHFRQAAAGCFLHHVDGPWLCWGCEHHRASRPASGLKPCDGLGGICSTFAVCIFDEAADISLQKVPLLQAWPPGQFSSSTARSVVLHCRRSIIALCDIAIISVLFNLAEHESCWFAHQVIWLVEGKNSCGPGWFFFFNAAKTLWWFSTALATPPIVTPIEGFILHQSSFSAYLRSAEPFLILGPTQPVTGLDSFQLWPAWMGCAAP